MKAQNSIIMISKEAFIVISLLAALSTTTLHASSTRDTTLDHRIPQHTSPVIDLSEYRSVQKRPNQNPDIAVAMAISGGGHRAANFAVGILLGLESFTVNETPINILNEIDYFSTVSGGGFAAGVYISSRYDHNQSHSKGPYSLNKVLHAHNNRILKNLERDYQSVLLASGFNPQTYGHKDSGDVLEQMFDDYILGAKYRKNNYSLQLSDIFQPALSHTQTSSTTPPVVLAVPGQTASISERDKKTSDQQTRAQQTSDQKPVFPFWFANATVYENGARFSFTPDVIRKYHIKEITHRMEYIKLNKKCNNMPLAVAIKTSASFPVAVPATTFTCADPNDPLNDYLHLMDGGLIDNLGVRSAFDALHQDKAPRRILIVVDAYKGSSFPLSKTETSPCGPQAAFRITKIALDSDHTLLKHNVLMKASQSAKDGRKPIDVIFLSFEDLKPENNKKIENIKEELDKIRKAKADAILRRVQREINITMKIKELELNTAKDIYDLYHDARAIATSLNITPAEQHLLLQAGQAVVNANHIKLKAIIQ